VKVQIKNPDSHLRPEMNTTVKFLADEPAKGAAQESTGVFVPPNAVRDRGGKKIVLIAFNDKAVAREVQIVSTRSNGVMVQGLVGGENVITSGPPTLKDGDKIKIKGQS